MWPVPPPYPIGACVKIFGSLLDIVSSLPTDECPHRPSDANQSPARKYLLSGKKDQSILLPNVSNRPRVGDFSLQYLANGPSFLKPDSAIRTQKLRGLKCKLIACCVHLETTSTLLAHSICVPPIQWEIVPKLRATRKLFRAISPPGGHHPGQVPSSPRLSFTAWLSFCLQPR